VCPQPNEDRVLARLFMVLTICLAWLAYAAPAGAQESQQETRPEAQPENQTTCGWIGVAVGPVTKPFAESLGMTEPYGAIFKRPQPHSPAARANIEAGDVLTTINGEPLGRWSDFTAKIAAIAPGTTVYLNTYRDRQLIGRHVTVGRAPCPPSPR
jgi:serine protease Do